MIPVDLNQQFYDPSFVMLQPNFIPGNEMLRSQPMSMNTKRKGGSGFTNMPNLHFPAIILLAFSWLLHALATFIPYWSTYSGISGSRAGLWSARNFNYYSIQNFYFPEPFTYGNVTRSVRFTGANTKGYLVTVQFLMTFNFVVMFIVTVLLIVDFIFAQNPMNRSRSFLIRDYNTSDTAVKFGLLLYIIYVLGVFEFAAWITYVASRHDNNWKMHVSFAFTVIVSVFLLIVFILYILEFIRIFQLTRKKWDYWYGPYVEWGFFIHLSALLLTLIVICCPEWAYAKITALNLFAEIGLFKQCYFTIIYKKSLSPYICTLSSSSSNRAWVNATQAFMLMAYIIGMIILILIVVFRKEFRHTAQGYHPGRVQQPLFTYIIAGLILFFCFIFTLIAVAIFGGEVFPNSVTVNWAYIIAVFAMVLFLVAGILFILDAVHSQKQARGTNVSAARKVFFPEPLNYRVLTTKPLIQREPVVPLAAPFDLQQLAMYQAPNLMNIPLVPTQQMMPMNPDMELYSGAPIAQATLSNYFRQIHDNPQLSSLPFNQGLMNYSTGYPLSDPTNIVNNLNKNMNDLVRQHFVQQQRLNYNHERLLERYSRLRTPRISEFRTFGSSSLPGRNYDEYLSRMRSGDRRGDSLAAWSRAAIGSSDETYRWMGDDDYYEPLPRDVRSNMQHSRNDPMPSVRAENFEPVQIYNHPVFGPTPAYIRPVFKKTIHSKTNHDDSENEFDLIFSDSDEEKRQQKMPIPTTSAPINPLLFNMYNHRSNRSIQGYGQSLYVPLGYRNLDKRSTYYEDISNPSLSDTKSVLPHATSASNKQHYNKLHSQPPATTVSHRQSVPATTENKTDLSGKETSRPNPPTAFLSRNNLNSLTSSIPPASHNTQPIQTAALKTNSSSVQNTSTINNADLTSSTPSSSNPLVLLATPSVSVKKPESVSTVTSVAPYQTLSSIYNDSTTTAPALNSTKTSSNEKTIVYTTNNKSIDDAISNSSDSDDEKKNKKLRQQKKKSTTTTNGNAEVNTTSSDY